MAQQTDEAYTLCKTDGAIGVKRRRGSLISDFLVWSKITAHTRLLLADADLAHAERGVLVVVGVLFGHTPPHARRGKLKSPRFCIFLESRHDLR